MEYHCPRCSSEDVLDKGEVIYCPQCNLHFAKDSLNSDIDDKNILSVEEMDEFLDLFEDLKDNKKVRHFGKYLDDDTDS
ncbi:MAG: hypothetical protein JSV62_06000 [Promethearchaeota archaeon]|nr:MAG: hypothetical protein JSV62_06000 [Candidatus Lokiarchaeota archaeon]